MTSLKDESGFTLVELLVSMAVLALIAIYSLQALTSIASTRQSSIALTRTVEINTALQFLKSRISTALPFGSIIGAESESNTFEGSPNTLRFKALINDPRLPAGIHDLSFKIEEGKLVLQTKLYYMFDAPLTNYVILGDVLSMSLIYDGHNSWRDDKELPREVELNLLLLDGQKKETRRKIVTQLLRH